MPLAPSPPESSRVGVAVVTRDRARELLGVLPRLGALPERPPIVVVDNASTDGTVRLLAERHPEVPVIALGENRGAQARNLAVERLGTPYVAFSDDDSWWEPGALAESRMLLERHPRLGAVAARVLLDEDGSEDPVCRAMAASPIRSLHPLPGPRVLGFVACGVVVRREAFLAVGGFHARYGIGGEEELLAIDLAEAGWDIAYVSSLNAHHRPAASRDRPARRRRQVRNALWSSWLRRPASVALGRTVPVLARALRDPSARGGLTDALRGLPWVLGERRRVGPRVEAALLALEAA